MFVAPLGCQREEKPEVATAPLLSDGSPSAPPPVVRSVVSGLAAFVQVARAVRPFVDCVSPGSSGLLVKLGYENRSPDPIDIPPGIFNVFLPGQSGKGPPSTFLPGKHSDALTLASAGPVAWLIAGNFAVATDKSPRCAEPIACPSSSLSSSLQADGRVGCDDGNPCTADVCGLDTNFKCRHDLLPEGTSCSDGNACTQGDVCSGGSCLAGAPVNCAAWDGCHPGVCAPETGACSNPTACTLVASGSLPATATDGLGAAPARLEDGTPHDQVGGIGSAIAYTGQGNLYVMTPDRGPGGGLDSFVERYYLMDIALTGATVTPVLRGGAALVPSAGAAPFIGLDRAFDRRLDVEGVRVSPQGTLFVSDEYGPYVYELAPTGERLRALPVPAKFLIDHPGIEDDELPPSNSKGRQANRGMEGLALSPDGSHLYGIMQSPLLQDGALDAANNRVGTNLRILEIDTTSGATRELVYPLDKASYGVNEILAVTDRQFLVLERDGKAGKNAAFKRLFLIDIGGASDVSDVAALPTSGLPEGLKPVQKTAFLDLLEPAFGLAGPDAPEKIEGLAFGPDLPDGRRLLLVTLDNDFLLAQDNRMLAFAIERRALPGFTPQTASFPTACALNEVGCAAAGTCMKTGLCNPGTQQCSQPLASVGVSCTGADHAPGLCDGAGKCVACLQSSDCPSTDDACQMRTCLAGLCGVEFRPAGTVVNEPKAGDCQRRVCDAGGHVVISAEESGGQQTNADGSCSPVPPPPPPPATTVRVLRVGDGSVALSNNAAPVTIEERGLDGTLVGTVMLPVTAKGDNQPFSLSGSADSEGGLALSADGHWVSLAGYATKPGLNAVASTSASSVVRVVARLDAAGNVDTSTLVTGAFNANNVRGVTSLDGAGFWVAGAGGSSGGVWYVPFGGGTAVQVLASPASVRWPGLSGGQLFATASTGSYVALMSIGSGAPLSAGQSATTPAGLPVSGSSSPFGFVFLDLDANIPGAETLYVADDRTAAKGGGVQRWRWNGASWALSATLNINATPIGFRGLTGYVADGRAVLVATTADAAANRLVTFSDDGTSAPTSGTVLVASPANTLFRGVALSPRP